MMAIHLKFHDYWVGLGYRNVHHHNCNKILNLYIRVLKLLFHFLQGSLTSAPNVLLPIRKMKWLMSHAQLLTLRMTYNKYQRCGPQHRNDLAKEMNMSSDVARLWHTFQRRSKTKLSGKSLRTNDCQEEVRGKY